VMALGPNDRWVCAKVLQKGPNYLLLKTGSNLFAAHLHTMCRALRPALILTNYAPTLPIALVQRAFRLLRPRIPVIGKTCGKRVRPICNSRKSEPNALRKQRWAPASGCWMKDCGSTVLSLRTLGVNASFKRTTRTILIRAPVTLLTSRYCNCSILVQKYCHH